MDIISLIFYAVIFSSILALAFYLARKPKDLKGQTILITGAAQGLGLELVKHFLLGFGPSVKIIVIDV